MHSGLMAFEAAGIAGVAGVHLAGWATADPTLYQAGLAFFSLAVCLVMGVLVFLGKVSDARYKQVFLAASVLWFVFSIARGKSDKGPAAGVGSGVA